MISKFLQSLITEMTTSLTDQHDYLVILLPQRKISGH